MKNPKFSEKMDILLFKPAEVLPAFSNNIHAIFKQSNSDLEFLARVRSNLSELLQYTRNDIALLPEQLCINANNYYLFYSVLEEMKKNLIAFETKKTLSCFTSKKNSREFKLLFEYYLEYIVDYNAKAYIFEIWEKGRETEDKFSFRLRIMENGKDLKVVDLIGDCSSYYLGKGISIAMILKSKEMFNKRIISSSNKVKTFTGEANYKPAIEKVWKRMVDKGLAEYDSKYDYYFTL